MEAILKTPFLRAILVTPDKSASLAEHDLNEANMLFKARNFPEALLKFNSAIRYALPESQTLAIAYLNRAALYLEYQKFAQSSENIQWARECNPPESVIEQLNDMEQKCRLEMMTNEICEELEDSTRLTESEVNSTDQKFDPWSFFKLSRPANEKIPFIINE